MPPLTLEQVLARSMRLPQSRARYSPLASSFKEPQASATAPQRRGGKGGSIPLARGHSHAQTLKLFDLLEKDEDRRGAAGRLSIQHSQQLVRTSNDLLGFLKTAQRMTNWEEGLTAFAACTGVSLQQLSRNTGQVGNSSSTSTSHATASSTSTSSSAPLTSSSLPAAAEGIVTPNAEHLSVLLDTCAAAGQWGIVVGVAQHFGQQFPDDVLVHAVRLMAHEGTPPPPQLLEALRMDSSSGDTASGWQCGLHFLLSHTTVPMSAIPVSAFNVLITACEEVKDWRGALRVVQSMGPNPLQGWDGAAVEPDTTTQSPSAPAASSSSSAPTTSLPPAPDVVSYATLIATMEQCGQDKMAMDVLNRLPPVEREEITASYAALIFVWSSQVANRRKK